MTLIEFSEGFNLDKTSLKSIVELDYDGVLKLISKRCIWDLFGLMMVHVAWQCKFSRSSVKESSEYLTKRLINNQKETFEN